jgi:hydrogenase nickel incorporation protein HypA/HybF
MHELHLMTQIVKVVETRLQGTGTAKLAAVRLKVSALSHLMDHDQATLQTAFGLAARGTKVEGAAVEIIAVPGVAWCPECRSSTGVTGLDDRCSACGGPVMADPSASEVMIHELVVAE